MLKIPLLVGDIDAEWLAHVLDAPVRSCRVADAHAGTTGRAVLELEYEGNTDLPPRLFVKLPPDDEMQRLFVTSAGMGRREALFYDLLSTEVPVRVPRSYFAASDDAGEHYIMLLEHLEDSGCTFNNASHFHSLDYVRSVLAAFARLHAAYWESPRFDTDLDWIDPPMQHEIAVQLVDSALQQHGADMPPVFTQMARLYLAQADGIHALWRRGPQTLIHGDVHDGNLFMDHGEPGFLDWAVLARGPAMRDVGYFLAGTLEEDERGALPDLLAYYASELVAAGATPPSAQDMWRQLQWHAAYVWVGATVTLAMGDAWQPVNYVMSSLQRLHGAMETLSSVEAIRAEL
ncbi:MAG: phosphotransferase [Halioglobus sp.]|nr:phosphotransferase [Halioglobus sp.]